MPRLLLVLLIISWPTMNLEAAAAYDPTNRPPVAGDGAVDITFFHVTDLHYLVDPANNTSLRAAVQQLNNLPGTRYPGGTNAVGVPWGVIASGDLINANGDQAAQWTNFVADFGLTGSDGVLRYPVYEGYGNHDQDSWLLQVSNRIALRNLTRPGVVSRSDNGVHYSWNWGPVHFVQMNMRVGPGPARYPPLNSLAFLQSDLAARVSNSGRPVIIIHHLPPEAIEAEWPAVDKETYYETIKAYNVIAILCGHTHVFAIGSWRGIPTIQTDNFADSFTVFRITANKLIAARRFPGSWDTVVTNAIRMPVAEPRIAKIHRRGSLDVELEITGDNCLDYSVWTSSDLSAWTRLYRTNSLFMPFRFTDSTPASSPEVRRFYRVTLGP